MPKFQVRQAEVVQASLQTHLQWSQVVSPKHRQVSKGRMRYTPWDWQQCHTQMADGCNGLGHVVIDTTLRKDTLPFETHLWLFAPRPNDTKHIVVMKDGNVSLRVIQDYVKHSPEYQAWVLQPQQCVPWMPCPTIHQVEAFIDSVTRVK